MKKLFIFLSVCIAATVSADDAIKFIGPKHEIFAKKKDQLLPDGKKSLFTWNSELKNSASYRAGNPKNNGFTVFGNKVSSAYIQISGETPAFITFTLFNRRDRQILTAEKFRKNMSGIYVQLKKRYPKIKPKMLRIKNQDDLTLNALVWISGKHACIMKWGIKGNKSSGEVPEYLQIEFRTITVMKDLWNCAIKPTEYPEFMGQNDRKNKTVQETNGDVYLKSFPMVVQPANGNSAACAVQRILEYKGKKPEKPIDAKPLKKNTKLNSDVEGLQLQLEDICKRNNLKLKTEYIFFYKDRSMRKLENLAGRYNRETRKSKKEKLVIPAGKVAPVAATIKKMTPATYIKLKNEEHGEQNFEGAIIQNIMGGQPLIWYVILGIVKEDKLPAKPPELHMRVIIGFNTTTKMIFYTDGWGKGHEIKKMSFKDAWPITLAAYTITPR
ncbi:MAG: hypothetical protein E7040_03500 [Lentisphaerae bacterium]|nr:hypothetical protein [Lentisphaerota bacterium]